MIFRRGAVQKETYAEGSRPMWWTEPAATVETGLPIAESNIYYIQIIPSSYEPLGHSIPVSRKRDEEMEKLKWLVNCLRAEWRMKAGWKRMSSSVEQITHVNVDHELHAWYVCLWLCCRSLHIRVGQTM